MANKRMITGDLFEDDICSEDFFTRLLWIGLIVAAADDQGRLIDNPAIMKARIFPFDNEISDDQINNSLIKIGKSILRYSSGGKKLIQIVNWWKYQTPSWAAESKYPAPEGWTDKVKVHIAGNKIRTFNWDKDGGFIDSTLHSSLPSCLDSTLPSRLDSAIDECEVKSDIKSECEPEHDTPLVSPVQRMIEVVTGLMPSNINDINALDEITAMNPTQDDIKSAYDWYVGHGKKFRYYQSLVGPIRTAIAARIQSDHTSKPSKVYEPAFNYVEPKP